MYPGKDSTDAVEAALELLRRQFPDASEDEIFDHFVEMARQDKRLQATLLSDEKLAAEVIAATRRFARGR